MRNLERPSFLAAPSSLLWLEPPGELGTFVLPSSLPVLLALFVGTDFVGEDEELAFGTAADAADTEDDDDCESLAGATAIAGKEAVGTVTWTSLPSLFDASKAAFAGFGSGKDDLFSAGPSIC